MIDIQMLPKNLQGKAISLSNLGINSYAWDVDDALHILDNLESDTVVLGGDIYTQDNGNITVAYANWYYEPIGKLANDHTGSIVKAKEYLQSLKGSEIKSPLVDLVISVKKV